MIPTPMMNDTETTRKTESSAMRIASASHAVFSATLIVIGVMGLIKGNFAAIWNGVPSGFPAREVLAYVCALISIASGVGLLWQRTAPTAARVLFGYLLLWMLLVKGRYIVLAPMVEGSYQSCGETAVIVAAAWVLYASFATSWDRRAFAFAVGDRGVHLAQRLYGLSLIAFGLSHFVYVELTTPLVPAWLPWHGAWAYITGSAFLAAGVAILSGIYARLAATLSMLQLAVFTLVVWVPMVVAGHISAAHWVEFVVSFVVTVAAWVVADSYRGTPVMREERSDQSVHD
jgi:uncharacterized membrane protein